MLLYDIKTCNYSSIFIFNYSNNFTRFTFNVFVTCCNNYIISFFDF